MIAKLSTNRKNIAHATTKGETSELNWIEWLRAYIPKRYKVDKAFVIDSNNIISEQMDLVIYDRHYSPFVFNQDGALYIPAESVYAVFEVKQELNKGHIEYAGKKIDSVRRLYRTSAPIVHIGGTTQATKPPFCILGGILTLNSAWNPALGLPLENSVKELSLSSKIDLGCVLSEGSFKTLYQDNKYISTEFSTKEESLIYFFLKLLMELQKLGTVPAMDINAYAVALDSI
jgi:hypothetical protein